ncbi:MAG: LysR family transcriptional regulator [bacterium]|nr:LysR family transcriptional regulator [bacterium]
MPGKQDERQHSDPAAFRQVAYHEQDDPFPGKSTMITLHKLKVFMVVCDTGSFNRAAQALYLTQSAVSQHIQTLEDALDTPLFERSARGAAPTPAGKVLYEYAVQVFALLGQAERAIMQLDPLRAAPLTLSATPGVSVYLLTGWLKRFQALHPQVNVSVQTLLTHDLVREMLDHRADLGFLEGELDELDQDSLGRMRVRDVEYGIVVNPAHPWAGRGAIQAADVAGEPFLNRQPGSRARRWMEGLFMAHGVRLRTTAELDSPGTIKYALLNNMGVAVLPRYTIEREIERGDLVLLPLHDLELKRPLLLVWDKRRTFSALQRAFITLLAEDAPQLQLLL